MINPRSIASCGFGFGALAIASIGLLQTQIDVGQWLSDTHYRVIVVDVDARLEIPQTIRRTVSGEVPSETMLHVASMRTQVHAEPRLATINLERSLTLTVNI
jgi:hypothetical protein